MKLWTTEPIPTLWDEARAVLARQLTGLNAALARFLAGIYDGPLTVIGAFVASSVAADQILAPVFVGGIVRPGARFVALSGTAAVTPDADTEQSVAIAQSGAGTTVDVFTPIGSPTPGQRLVVACANESAGAVTWAFAAGYHLDAALGAPAPAAGNTTIVTFERLDLGSAIRWYEVSRVTCAI